MLKKMCITGLACLALVACGTADVEQLSSSGSLAQPALTATAIDIPPTLIPTVEPSSTAEIDPTATIPTPVTTIPTDEDEDNDQDEHEDQADSDSEHPVAADIAEEFGVAVSEVEDYHSNGIGYGILAQFYGIAYNRCGVETNVTVAELITLKESGMGMGEIRNQYLGHQSAANCNLGHIRGNKPEDVGKPENPGNGNSDKDKEPVPPAAAPPANPGNGNAQPPANPGNGNVQPPANPGNGKGNGGGKKDK